MKQLWTFRVSGGKPFRIQVKGNPIMTHDGGTEALLKCLCTHNEATKLEAEIRSHGCTVEGHSPHETAEQQEKRRNLLHVLGGEQTFPCVACPECAWFEPVLVSLCGAGLSPMGDGVGWEPEVIEGAMKNEKFASDFQACPLQEKKALP